LKQLGYNPGPIDGAYGRKTEAALSKFYTSQGGQFDGTLDANEIEYLKLFLSSASVETASNTRYYSELPFDIYNSDRGFYRDLGNSNLARPFGHGDTNPRYHNFAKLDERIPASAVRKRQNCDEFCFGSMNVSQPLRFEWFRIDQFYEKPLSKEYLNKLQAYFDDARRNKYKLIVRWAYTFPNEADDPNFEVYKQNKLDKPKSIKTPELPIILNHIDQLSVVVNRNSDVITSLQAGMIGAWGEWHSDQYGDWKRWNKARLEVLKKWLESTDENIIVQIRYPQDYVRREIQRLPGFDRVGIHHDCPNYAKDNIEFVKYRRKIQDAALITGEMCQSNPLNSYSCKAMLSYFEKYKFTALRVGFPDEIFNDWYEQGCLSEIRDRLGYRFVIRSSRFDGQYLRIEIENKGFAAIQGSKPLSIKYAGKSYKTSIDAHDWEPGRITQITLNLDMLGLKVRQQTELELSIESGVKFLNETGNKIFLN